MSRRRPASPSGPEGLRPAALLLAVLVIGFLLVRDRIDRSPPRPPTATERLLATLVVEPEHDRGGYDRDRFPHWDDADHDGCDTRCEILAASLRGDGTWLSAWDAYSTDDRTELQIDHVVALAEAWDSGADRWSFDRRNDFADDPANLLAVSAAANQRKSDRDASEWFPSNSGANCLWATTVVRVKAAWSLSVDRAEREALANLLARCPS